MLFDPGSDLVGWAQTFAPLFSTRVWPGAQAPLFGAIRAPGRRTGCSILRVLGLDGMVHFQIYHRVLNRARWSALGAARRLLQELVETFVPQGPLVLGMDETIERRWGRCIAARGIYRDAARSSQSVTNKTSGLRWVSVQLLAWAPWSRTIWALPFLPVLAPSARDYQHRRRLPQKLPPLLQARRAAWYARDHVRFCDALGGVRDYLWKKSFCLSMLEGDHRKISRPWLNHLTDVLCSSQ
jgi:hypothetical protein